MRHLCYFCHQRSVQELINKFKPQDTTAADFVKKVHQSLSDNWNNSNPILATYTHRIARECLKVDNLYAEEKRKANSVLLQKYNYWKNYIHSQDESFSFAAKLAVIGNIIDYGAHSVEDDLVKQIQGLLQKSLLIDETKQLKEALKKAKNVLYLGDNAGEIVFDKLFIELIAHKNLTYVTRGYPVINDVTEEDVQEVGMKNVCKVIDNGSDAPSTLLPLCSDSFLHAYNNADLIISKGQGNFEGLMYENHPNTFFLLIAKCKPIAELLGIKSKNLVITRYNK